MPTNKALASATLVTASLLLSAYASLPPEQVTRNEQTRLAQQLKGYPDRESRAEQKEAEQRAFEESLKKK